MRSVIIVQALLGVLLMWRPAHLQAQPIWDIFNVDNSGLPENGITALAADANGSIWVGTETGLVFYDGATWTPFFSGGSGLPDNAIRSLAVDQESGTLWVGTFMGGLASYDGLTWQVWNTGNSPLPENFVREIVIEGPDRIWLGTTAGLALKEGDTWTVWNTFNSDLPGNNIPSVYIAADGTPWVGTINSGIARFNGKGWENWTITNSDLVDNTILDIAADTEGNLWLATPAGGLIIMTPSASFLTFNTINSGIPDNEISRIAFDPQERGLLGMTAAGVSRFDNSTWEVFDTASTNLPDKNVRALMVSPDSVIWVGTLKGGLARWKPGESVGITEPEWLWTAENFILFPNPARAGEAVFWGDSEMRNLSLYDQLGRCIDRQQGEGSMIIPANLDPGWYVLEQEIRGSLVRKPLMVSR